MANLWLGPAGVGVGCKDRSTLGGVKYVAELKLNAMEIEYVRGVKMGLEMAKEVGKVAKELDIKLSVHAPYFTNLCSQDEKKLEASKRMIFDSALRAHAMGADIVVFHPGFYQKLTPKQALEAVETACADLAKRFKESGIGDVRIGLETTGKVSQFGELDEIVEICKKIKSCCPVVDFAHIFARQAGKIDYGEIFDKLKQLKLTHLHTHFTCVEFSPIGVTGKGNERYHLELKANKPSFEPLAKEILKRKLDITIISESPKLEIDSIEMKKIFERLGYKF